MEMTYALLPLLSLIFHGGQGLVETSRLTKMLQIPIECLHLENVQSFHASFFSGVNVRVILPLFNFSFF